MKTLFTILLFSTSTFIQAQDTAQGSSTSSKPVLNVAVQIWKSSYIELRKNELISQDTTYDLVFFSKQKLSELKDINPDATEAVFRYYMEEGRKTPRISVRNPFDSTKYLINSNGEEKIVDASVLSEKFQCWENFLLEDTIPFIYIKEYAFCWDRIDAIISKDSIDQLAILNVAKTISPRDDSYLHRDNVFAGYIAFDLLFTFREDPMIESNLGITNTGNSEVKFYNFASPCPKLCPGSAPTLNCTE